MSLAEAREAWRPVRSGRGKGDKDPALVDTSEKPATAFAAVAEEWLKRDQSDNKSIATATSDQSPAN